jgi:hypothetical protein
MNTQLWSATAVIVLGYVIGFYFQRREIDDIKQRLGRIVADLRQFYHELGRHEGEIESLRRK